MNNYNHEHYPDPTATEGMKPLMKEENHIQGKLNTLIKVLKAMIDISGFELVGRMHLRHKETGREFR